MADWKHIKQFTLCCFILVVQLLSGCVTQTSGTLGRSDQHFYQEISDAKKESLLKSLEEETNNIRVSRDFKDRLAKVSSVDARRLCSIYCNNENFSKCDACLEFYLKRDDIKAVMERTCQRSGQTSHADIISDFYQLIPQVEEKSRMCLMFSDYDCARVYADKYAEIITKLEWCPGNRRSIIYTNAAEIHAILGEKDIAENYLATAMELAKSSNSRNSIIISAVNKAEITVRMATGEYQKAYIILKDPKDYLNKTYGERLEENLRNRDSSAAVVSGALQLAAVLGGINQNVANLGSTAANVGSVALSILEEAAADIENLPYRNYQLAKCDYELGRFSEAKKGYENIIASKSHANYSASLQIVYHDLGNIYAREKDYSRSIQNLKKSISLIEKQRSSINTETAKIGFVQDKQRVYYDLVITLLAAGKVAEAFEYTERSKARALVDMLAGKKSFGDADLQDQSRQLLEAIQEGEENQASNIMAATAAPGKNGRKKIRRSTATTEIESKNNKLKQLNPAIASLVTVEALSCSSVQSKLRDDETLLEFFGYQTSLIAFVITRENIHAVTINAPDLADTISRFRKQILNLDSSSYLITAKEIYSQLIIPVKPYLQTEKMTVVAHGSLHYLPFNALYDGSRFMIEEYSMRILPSASVLTYLKTNANTNNNLLILSNPDLGIPGSELPFAGQEGQGIAKNNSNARHLSLQAATETALKEYGSSASYLHLASHGEFNVLDPLNSRLLLAGDSRNDGSLTVGELYNLNFNNTLVTLSACETGLGEIKTGNDVIGLTRGFLFAGAESIVTSLWKVEDKATAALMVNFYQELKNRSKQEALRQAQINILRNVQNPFYWAAFQLTGSAWDSNVISTDEIAVVDKKTIVDFNSLPLFSTTASGWKKYIWSTQPITAGPMLAGTPARSMKIVSPRKRPVSSSKPSSFRVKRVLEIYADEIIQGDGKSPFLPLTPKINVALNLNPESQQTFVFIVVLDKSRNKTIFEIPVVIDTISEPIVTSLRRPGNEWLKGAYQVIVRDIDNNILSKEDFTIDDE